MLQMWQSASFFLKFKFNLLVKRVFFLLNGNFVMVMGQYMNIIKIVYPYVWWNKS